MIFIGIFLIFAVIGMIDKLLNGRYGLADAFDQGLAAMGPLAVSIAGIYCGTIWLMNHSAQMVTALQQLPFDASLLIGSILAPDLGGWPLCEAIAQSTAMGHFSGLLVSSSLGCLISFALPISFGLLAREDRPLFTEGVLWGIAALPAGLLFGGLILGMDRRALAMGVFPIAVICGLLYVGLRLCPKALLWVLTLFGNLVRLLGMILFGILIFGLFVPDRAVFSPALAGEALQIIVKITAVVCGSLVASQLAMTYLEPYFDRLAKHLEVNLPSILGLVLSLVSSVAMLPLYQKMDNRGKQINGAFVVGGAFCLGGQMAYVTTVSDSRVLAAYMACKLLSGILAVILVYLSSRSHRAV